MTWSVYLAAEVQLCVSRSGFVATWPATWPVTCVTQESQWCGRQKNASISIYLHHCHNFDAKGFRCTVEAHSIRAGHNGPLLLTERCSTSKQNTCTRQTGVNKRIALRGIQHAGTSFFQQWSTGSIRQHIICCRGPAVGNLLAECNRLSISSQSVETTSVEWHTCTISGRSGVNSINFLFIFIDLVLSQFNCLYHSVRSSSED